MLVHGVFYKYGPVYLNELLVPVSELPGRTYLRSSESIKFDVPRVKLAIGGRSFSVAGPRTWNDLPRTLRAISDKQTFKGGFKTHFFNCAFNC